jgi:hypothetical protein
MFQSVLTELEWGDVSSSPFLTALKKVSQNGKLSIKFNVDGYDINFKSLDFTHGRIVGTIGPSSSTEPNHFTVGRHFMAAAGPNGNFFAPGGQVNFCVAVIDERAGKIVLDLGNALPTPAPRGDMSNLGALALAYVGPASVPGGPQFLSIGPIDYLGAGWYEKSAGVVTLPAGRALTKDELLAIGQTPLVMTATSSGITNVAIAEPSNGTYVRADQYVFRLNPGDTANVTLIASQWGKPYSGARIVSVFDPSQLQPQAISFIGQASQIGLPLRAIEFPARIIADNDGVAELQIHIGDPGDPRDSVDGQVYGIRSMLEENLDFGAAYNFNPWEFVSLLVWSGFAKEDPPTWHGSIQAIFQQYANLYPVMKRIVDLADFDSVCGHVDLLRLAFGLPVEDPNSMPVTRDLSSAKRNAILRWLGEPGPDGKPRKGLPGPSPAAPLSVASPKFDGAALRGGKAVAASRRLMLRNKLL